jgi:hypothetical protein
MSIKYKIDDAKKNKNLINDEIKLSRVKSKGGPGDGGKKPGSKNKMTLDKLAKIVTDGFAEQAKFNTRIEKQVSDLRSDVTTLKTNLNRVIKLNNLKH